MKRAKLTLNAGEKIQAVYDMELNAEISWFWDRGFDVTFGDTTNGIKDSCAEFRTFDEAAEWLYNRAMQYRDNRE